ncbi:LLM class flavin-dependent oxidoreductase [Nocardia sputorum]|uniref:Alkanesulfonate monooxygenase n=1 Tax=Nocardia sputorum TaxID=2984338 RepID=A0ABM8D0D9_9NOCA|nr:LLM class flavin-dependent oxidoreductase [Nocardia sputorum]BDT92190.1 alkanesulfonate monooxygenase [Nocardia sputorum]BDU00793.1 alkanesulfonate monooxygenase [Nocardia sputorum]
MTEFLWRLPSRGDGRHAPAGRRNRGGFGGPAPLTPATDLRPGHFGPFDDLAQIIDAAELAGLDGVLAPYDPQGEESWIVAGGALRGTRHSRVVVEFQPAFGTPVYAAKISATLQRISGGRLAWQLAVDTDPADARARGDRVTGDDRYARAAEFLTVARGVWNEAPVPSAGFAGTGFHYEGAHYDVIDGGFRGILSGLPFPAVYLTGDSAAALELSAAHGDVHVFTETAAGVGAAIAALRERATAVGRTVRAGLELPVIARETEEEAWARVDRQWREVHPDGPDAREHDLGDGRWAGFADLGYAAAIGLVGSYAQVAQQLSRYAEAGIDSVVLSGHPHIEELHRAGEHLLFLADPVGRTMTAQEATA